MFCAEAGRDHCLARPGPRLEVSGPAPKPSDKLAAGLGLEAVSSPVQPYPSMFLLAIMLLVARNRITQFKLA